MEVDGSKSVAAQIPLGKLTRSTNKQKNTKVGRKFVGKRGDWQEIRDIVVVSNKNILYMYENGKKTQI